MWRPSRRTSLTARVGRRYGDTIYTGSFAYRPDHDTMLQVGVYDGMSSFVPALSSGLSALPTQFDPTPTPNHRNTQPSVFGPAGGGCLTHPCCRTHAIQSSHRRLT